MVDVELTVAPAPLPDQVATYLREADSRVHQFVRGGPFSMRGFVPSDFVTLYHALRIISETHLACGNAFCEWGSGLGVVASLAAMLGFDAYGIEVDRKLYDASEELASDFGIPVEFVNASFIPQGSDELIDTAFADNDGELSLEMHADDGYDELGLDVDDFDVVFAFPWPNDEQLTVNLFEAFAADRALLLTYSELDSVRLRRK